MAVPKHPTYDGTVGDKVDPDEHLQGVLAWYDRDAGERHRRYQSMSFAQVHSHIAHRLPSPPGLVLDIGAGPGRDAAEFVRRGYTVIAVEPSEPMRNAAVAAHAGVEILWLNDHIPDLPEVQLLGSRFDVILASSVWMHPLPEDCRAGFHIVASLLAAVGVAVVTVSYGLQDSTGVFREVSPSEFQAGVCGAGLVALHESQQSDVAGRPGVSWRSWVLRHWWPRTAQ